MDSRKELAMMRFATATGLVVLFLGSTLKADEQAVPLKDVPKAVLDAVKAKFPKAELKEAAKETEDDETIYEISLVNDGKNVTVSVEDDGEIEEIETEITAADLPKAVTDALAKTFPKSTVKSAEKVEVTDEDEKETLYEVTVATADGKTVEVILEEDGEIEKDESEEEWTSNFASEKSALVSTGRNPYFILEPGYQIVLADGDDSVTITVLGDTKVVDGVETRVVEEREVEGGKLIEVSRNFYAISTRTNSVYYFGEEVDIYKDGTVTGHEGAWLAGVDGAKFGLMMPGLPILGGKYYQELAPGKAMDRAEVVGLSAVIKTPAGEFKNCLKTEESTPLESGKFEFKHYAPGIGQVQDESLKLTRYGKVEAGKK
jgi:hypothetical protein